jgi:hypothetical protein
VKNLHAVLIQKEQDVARVRKEIQALLTVIPLLADNASVWDELEMHFSNCSPETQQSISEGMAALELYYPFVRNLQSIR